MCWWSGSVYTKEELFCFQFEFLGVQAVRFALYQRNAENDWLVGYFILSLRMPTLFIK